MPQVHRLPRERIEQSKEKVQIEIQAT
jgi:hypothetical protein